MQTELTKIVLFLEQAQSLVKTNAQLVTSRQFFELWEQAQHPRPFFIKGPNLRFGQWQVTLPTRNRYIGQFVWDCQHNCPTLSCERAGLEIRFPFTINNEKVGFGDPKIQDLSHQDIPFSEKMELIHDVIDYVRQRFPIIDILSLKKGKLTEIFQTFSDRYEKKFLRQMARLPLSQIRQLIRDAASDMAADELSPQIGLPFDDSYAFDVTEDNLQLTHWPENCSIPDKTHWQIVQEVELLAEVAKVNRDVQKHVTISLADANEISVEDVTVTSPFIRIPEVANLPLREGTRLFVRKQGEKGSVGSFKVGMYDGDTIYGPLQLDNPEDIQNLAHLYLEPEKSQSDFIYRQMTYFYHRVRDQVDEIAGAVVHVLGIRPFSIDFQLNTNPEVEMDLSQTRAWAAAINSNNPVVTIQGPPGTGKTWVLEHILRFLCRQGQRILVVAPSNAAVDNICRRVLDLPVLRIGQSGKIASDIRSQCWAGDLDHVDAFLEKQERSHQGTIYMATQMRALFDPIITAEIDQNGLFDLVAFDEGGMARMDEFLLCTNLARRVVILGDHKQLPPFPLANEVINRIANRYPCLPEKSWQMVHCSALEWLIRNRQLPVVMLLRSYRCQNPRLLRFASILFYGAQVKTSPRVEYFRLPYKERMRIYPRSTLRLYRTSALPQEMRQEQLVFEGSIPGLENACEAQICKRVLLESLETYQPRDIMIISPYRRQTRLIRELLSSDEVMDRIPESIPIDQWTAFLNEGISTVDSFQGGECDLVIISYVRSNVGGGIGFVGHPNRINVAHTRCRRSLVVIGDMDCLIQQANSDIFEKMLRAFARDGEIIDVDENFFQ